MLCLYSFSLQFVKESFRFNPQSKISRLHFLHLLSNFTKKMANTKRDAHWSEALEAAGGRLLDFASVYWEIKQCALQFSRCISFNFCRKWKRRKRQRRSRPRNPSRKKRSGKPRPRRPRLIRKPRPLQRPLHRRPRAGKRKSSLRWEKTSGWPVLYFVKLYEVSCLLRESALCDEW